jgi:hypothetical protein
MRYNSYKLFLISVSVLAFTTQSHAQSASRDAVQVCEAQRAPFVQIRTRNREIVQGRVFTGIAVGLLGGAVAGRVATDGQSKDTQKTAMVAGALIGALAGGVDQYLAAKREITNDNRELARIIDGEARSYSSRIEALTTSVNSVGDCRQSQIAAYEQRLTATRAEFTTREAARASALTAVTDAREKRRLEAQTRTAARADGKILEEIERESARIQLAINDDKTLFSDVLKYFDDDILAMAEAQARVEGTSAASLRGPAEGYVVEVIPPAIMAATSGFGSTTSGFGSTSSGFASTAPTALAAPAPAPPPPPPTPPVYIQSASLMRAEPNAQSAVVVSLAIGAPVQNLGIADGVVGWLRVSSDGVEGFVPAARVGLAPPQPVITPTRTASAPKGKAKAAPRRTAAVAPLRPQPAPVVRRAPPPPPVPPYMAQVRRPVVRGQLNGHGSAFVQRKNMAAAAQATTMTNTAYLGMVTRGSIQLGRGNPRGAG